MNVMGQRRLFLSKVIRVRLDKLTNIIIQALITRLFDLLMNIKLTALLLADRMISMSNNLTLMEVIIDVKSVSLVSVRLG